MVEILYRYSIEIEILILHNTTKNTEFKSLCKGEGGERAENSDFHKYISWKVTNDYGQLLTCILYLTIYLYNKSLKVVSCY